MQRLALVVFIACCICPVVTQGDDWPQWRGPRRDGTWTETGLVEKFSSPQLPLRWRTPIGPGYCGPTVANGRVFVMDRKKAGVPVERIHCLDESTGEIKWTVSYDSDYGGIGYPAGPRASVTIDGDLAYALGSAGHIHCLEAATGEIRWQRDLNEDYAIEMPIWGVAASPLIVGDRVILHIGGSNGACIVALDKASGEERWKALNDRGQYSSPILVRQAGKPVVVCWTGDAVVGLDADDGRTYWRETLRPRNMPIGVATPVVDDNRLFVTSFYDGSMLLKLSTTEPKARQVWHRIGLNEQNTDALHSIISTPVIQGDYIYGVDSHGELRCLEASTGERVWENLSATPKARWSTIHFVVNGDRVWMFNERGELIIGRLSPDGYQEISRAKLIRPTMEQLPQRNGVCWSHPAFANRHIFARNDDEIVCASLAAE